MKPTTLARHIGMIAFVVCLSALAACSEAAPTSGSAKEIQSPLPVETKAPVQDASKAMKPEESSPAKEPSPTANSTEPAPVPLKEEATQQSSKQATATSSTYKGASATTGKSAGQAAIANDRKAVSWYYMKQPKGKVPNFPNETKQYTDNMKALWVGTGKKVYLTIDTGGPLGDMDLLVKSLKDNDAKANFFIAGYNVKKAPDFVRTLVKDGHLVANHTMTHTDMNLQTDEQVKKEIEDYEKLYKEVTGKDIQPYFRFPYGRYNMHLLSLVSDMGYKSVFWSTAMKDWEPRKNGAEDPYNDIMNNLHDGNIILMHQGSPENIEALDRIIKGVRQAGYEFALLTDIQTP
ncbi:delta-lactam-biosynthetic de-N-acetylase [Paenibacillus radicis (ex Xue et al. 2023)]|uniref:Polysaccharide deacetylase family protein n=1 Tax=Paenibacillus radicis (ex Xue et al. 2023) TaxID=2972489 RepID=A0ABT1YGG4_9BACL|nr:polysaccharide deacetylase family protein [Paenibacillus radicis (ex Xue et al. 2023)]MCR8631050.1 polysaccharide deacetylase family protein [Paenibacillus radicis (ex Xue et al. 2023)]